MFRCHRFPKVSSLGYRNLHLSLSFNEGNYEIYCSWWSFNYDRRYNFLCTSNFLNYISLMGLAYSCCSMLFSAVDISQHKLPDYPVMVLSATLKICALLCMKLSFERVPAHRSMVVSTAAKCAIMLYVLVFSDQFQIRLFIRDYLILLLITLSDFDGILY